MSERGVWENRGALQDEEALRYLTEAARLARAGQSPTSRAGLSSATADAGRTQLESWQHYVESRFSEMLRAYQNSNAAGTPTGPPLEQPSMSTGAREKDSRAESLEETVRVWEAYKAAYGVEAVLRTTWAELDAWDRQPEWPFPNP